MRRFGIAAVVGIAIVVTLPLVGKLAHRNTLVGESPHKVFVILGFHANFYHSWRGDTPDEAGFGTDIRIVREILRMLDEANAQGLDARGYWESENQFTLESIIPEYAPDIIRDIRRRVQAGQDEALVAPYNNGFFSGMTEEEVCASLRWAVSNPWGSGVEDLYGKYYPMVRPQEVMFTPGLIPLLEQEGMTGVTLSYSSYPFTAFSNFVEPLTVEQRYGLTWLRTEPGGPKTLLFPFVSLGDVIDHVSLEKWMLELRDLQVSGKVEQDLVIHINFDADAESWVPLQLPPGLRSLPNTQGLWEYIDAVNKYDWAEFTVPSEFIEGREPTGEVVVLQDTADGAWDGYYSWSEKFGSHEVWTAVEQSRLYEAQMSQLASAGGHTRLQAEIEAQTFAGKGGVFWERLRALSTTHFGMSTPMVNEERYAVALEASGKARDGALSALRSIADRHRAQSPSATVQVADYSFEVLGDGSPGAPFLRVPLLLRKGQVDGELLDDRGRSVPFSIVNLEPVDDRWVQAELLVAPQPGRYHWTASSAVVAPREAAVESAVLRTDRLQLALSSTNGVDSLIFGDQRLGGPDFLTSFITYRTDDEPESYWADGWAVEVPSDERTRGVQRARLRTDLGIATPDGPAEAQLEVEFTLPDGAPWVVADFTVAYPYTRKRDIVATPQQKLRKLIDQRWIEVAPFQLHPNLASRGRDLRVWRENYLGVVAAFPLNYGDINPKNANLDSFNHHVTGPWMSVGNGERGLLLAQSAPVRTSANFAPMRLREVHGRQEVWINPFGSYYGEQLDYSHLGGPGLGRDFTVLVSPALRPNGPSYNGRTERFSLLLAPYEGDAPPDDLQAAARAFFHPPTVVYLRTPAAVSGRLPVDLRRQAASQREEYAKTGSGPLARPRAFLASPTEGAVDLVWDSPNDPRVAAYEVGWKSQEDSSWHSVRVDAQRYRVALENGVVGRFRVRALAADDESAWVESEAVEVGPVGEESALGFASAIPPGFVARVLHQSLVHLLTVP